MTLAVVETPAGFVPLHATAFAAPGAPAVAVDAAHPLPVAPTRVAAASTPLTGTMTASGVAGPFAPELYRALWLSLWGTWSGSVQLLRSTDGGTTRLPLTVAGQPWGGFTANANEQVAEETESAATYYLAATIVSGTLSYRVSQ